MEKTKVPQTGTERRFGLLLSDPAPPEGVSNVWRVAAQAATIGMFVLALIAMLWFARPVLLPTATAIIVGLMFNPLSSRADKLGIPVIVTAIVLWLLVVAAFYGLIVLLSAPVGDWISKAPEIASNIKSKLYILDRPFAAIDELRKTLFPQEEGKPAVNVDLMSVIQPAVLFVTPAIGQIVVFFGVLFFFLLGRLKLRHVLVAFFDSRETRLRTLKIMNDVEHNLSSYLSVVAVINLVVGIAAGMIAYFVGLPNAIAWGVLGFLLNFIPYIGALLMQLILFALGLVVFPTLTHALLAPLLYLGFTMLEGHFVTPAVMGARLTLNPLTVFLALVFWTWLWGPIGAFLAVPILIVMLVIASHVLPKEEPALPE